MPRKLCRWSLRDGVKLVGKRGAERQASVTRKPCVLLREGAGGGQEAKKETETQRTRQNLRRERKASAAGHGLVACFLDTTREGNISFRWAKTCFPTFRKSQMAHFTCLEKLFLCVTIFVHSFIQLGQYDQFNFKKSLIWASLLSFDYVISLSRIATNGMYDTIPVCYNFRNNNYRRLIYVLSRMLNTKIPGSLRNVHTAAPVCGVQLLSSYSEGYGFETQRANGLS